MYKNDSVSRIYDKNIHKWLTLTAGVNKLFTISRLSVKPPSIWISSTITLLSRKLAHILWTRTADSTKSSASRSRFATVSCRTSIGTTSSGRTFHVTLSTWVFKRLTSSAQYSGAELLTMILREKVVEVAYIIVFQIIFLRILIASFSIF